MSFFKILCVHVHAHTYGPIFNFQYQTVGQVFIAIIFGKMLVCLAIKCMFLIVKINLFSDLHPFSSPGTQSCQWPLRTMSGSDEPTNTNEPVNKIMVLITCATSEGSGEPAHPHSPARAFALRCSHR